MCDRNIVFSIFDIDLAAVMNIDLLERTRKFTYDVLELAEMLPNTFLGNHIRGQLIRCGTSVSSNYRAARLAQSRASFVAKISIVLEEADETAFWCETIEVKGLVQDLLLYSVKKEANELTSLFISSRKTIQTGKLKNHNS